MTVLVHLNHGIERSYLLAFEKSMSKDEVRGILNGDESGAAQALLMKSIKQVEIPSKDRQKAEAAADFVVSQYGYTSERLA